MNKPNSKISALLNAIRDSYTGYLPEWSDKILDRFQWLVACGRLILPKYRFKWPQMSWWDEAEFHRYLAKFDELDGMNTERRWDLGQVMWLTENVLGDTAECGCYKGAGSYLICEINARQKTIGRMHHIFDSFEGLSMPGSFDGDHWKSRDLAASEKEVELALADFKGVYRLYKGWIPSRFNEVADKRFSFVHLDVDLYEPTRDSVSFFYSQMNPGAILLCDDYGFTSCPGARKAIDDFLRDKPERMIALSSGGAFFMKAVGPIDDAQVHR